MPNYPLRPALAAAAPPDTAPARSTGLALACLALATLLPSLGTSIVNAGLPTLAEVFHASFQAVQWVVLAYLLAITTLVVGVGRLGDIVGRKRLLLVGLSLFTGGSLLGGGAPTLALLIAARVVQGIGAAISMALAIALLGETVPRGNLGRAMGLLGAMSAVGTALGPALGGGLLALCGWRALFLVNVPLGLVALGLAARQLPNDACTPRTSLAAFDARGLVLLGGTLMLYALALTLGRGRFDWLNAGLLLAAAVGAGWFALAQARTPVPLVHLPTLRDPERRTSLVLSLVVATVLMATLVIGPFYLSRALRLGVAETGLALSLGPLAAALTGVPAGRIVDRRGTRETTLLGLGGMTVATAFLSVQPAASGVTGYLGAIAVLTASYALFQTANNTAVMAGAGSGQRGVLSGVLNLSRYLGLITGSSFMGAVFSYASGASNVSTAPAEAVATGTRGVFWVATLLLLAALALAAQNARARRAGTVPAAPTSSG